MIPIEKYFSEHDRQELYNDFGKKNVIKDKKKIPLFDALVAEKEKHSFRANLYGTDKIEDKLLTFFNGKCAFCERFHSDETKKNRKARRIWQIEHYRPKAGINSYYWLGYECTNLLLSCYACNTTKGGLFDIVGSRAEASNFIENEKIDFSKCHINNPIFEQEEALSINPVIHLPKKYLKFNSDGTIEGKDRKGEQSIKIYNLDRPDLNRARKTIVDNIRKSIQKSILAVYLATNHKPTEYIFEHIINDCLINLWKTMNYRQSEFIAFRATVFENFVDFIIKNTNGIGSDSFIMPYVNDLEKAYKRMHKSS